jgi:hypothetical protein
MRIGWCIFAVVTIGCGGAPKPIFAPVNPPIGWPEPPEPARVRYVGQLATSADLKRKVGGLEAIGGALFGKSGARSMLTPYNLCTDGQSRVFVADSNAQTVHVFDLTTRRYTTCDAAQAKSLRPTRRRRIRDCAGTAVRL